MHEVSHDLTDTVIETPRLTLRAWRPDDAPAVAAACQDAETQRWLAGLPAPYTVADALDFVTGLGQAGRADGSALNSAVVRRDTGELVGAVGITGLGSGAGSEIGYWVSPGARGGGYAAEATRAVAEWAFGRGIYRVFLRADSRNGASQRTAENAGFRREGDHRGIRDARGQVRDDVIFGRLANDGGEPTRAGWPLPGPLAGQAETADWPHGPADGVIGLRMREAGDAAAVIETTFDPAAVDRMVGPVPDQSAVAAYCAATVRGWLAGTSGHFVAVDLATDQVAGTFSLFGRDATLARAEVGYGLRPGFRGRGIATRAVRLLARWGFEAGGLARLEAGIAVGNTASRRVVERVGFRLEGTRRRMLPRPDGTRDDAWLFGLLPEDLSPRA